MKIHCKSSGKSLYDPNNFHEFGKWQKIDFDVMYHLKWIQWKHVKCAKFALQTHLQQINNGNANDINGEEKIFTHWIR